MIPMGPEMNYIGERPFNPITLDIYVYKKAEFTLYDDKETITFKGSRNGQRIMLGISASKKRYILKFNKVNQPAGVTFNARELEYSHTKEELDESEEGWWSWFCISLP